MLLPDSCCFVYFVVWWIVLQACAGLYTIISGMINGPHLKGEWFSIFVYIVGWPTWAFEEERDQNKGHGSTSNERWILVGNLVGFQRPNFWLYWARREGIFSFWIDVPCRFAAENDEISKKNTYITKSMPNLCFSFIFIASIFNFSNVPCIDAFQASQWWNWQHLLATLPEAAWTQAEQISRTWWQEQVEHEILKHMVKSGCLQDFFCGKRDEFLENFLRHY